MLPGGGVHPIARELTEEMPAVSMIDIFSIALCIALCLFANPIDLTLGIIDHPDGSRKLHSAPTPLMGGLVISLPLIFGLSLAVASGTIPSSVVVLAVASGIMLLLGLWDDRSGLAVPLKSYG